VRFVSIAAEQLFAVVVAGQECEPGPRDRYDRDDR
jgi:hypothetical protein